NNCPYCLESIVNPQHPHSCLFYLSDSAICQDFSRTVLIKLTICFVCSCKSEATDCMHSANERGRSTIEKHPENSFKSASTFPPRLPETRTAGTPYPLATVAT